MTFKTKFVLSCIIGIALVIACSITGCGGVELAGLETDGGAGAAGGEIFEGGAAGAGGAGGTAGTSSMAGAAGIVGTAGMAGTTGMSVAGTSGAAGSAPVRPLGAGCSVDNQCGSGICASDINGAKACCDGLPDICTTCVGGYKIPRSNGTGCGTQLCDGTDRKWDLCMNGVCERQVVHCATALCDKAGNKICPGGAKMAGCALENNPCFCYDGADSGHVSYPCP